MGRVELTQRLQEVETLRSKIWARLNQDMCTDDVNLIFEDINELIELEIELERDSEV